MRQTEHAFDAGFLNPGAVAFLQKRATERIAAQRRSPALTFVRNITAAVALATIAGSDAAPTPLLIAPVEIVVPALPDRSAWTAYLAGLDRDDGPVDRFVVRFVRSFLQTVWEDLPHLSDPRAGPNPDGSFELVWDRGAHQVVVSFHASGVFDWFYRNRDTAGVEGGEDCKTKSFPVRLKEALSFVA